MNVFGATTAKFTLGVPAFVHSNGIAPSARGVAITPTARFTFHFKPAALFCGCRCWFCCCYRGCTAFAVGTFLGFAVDVFGASDAIVALGVAALVHPNGIAPGARGIATTETACFSSQLKATALLGSFNASVVDLCVAARTCGTVAIRVARSAAGALSFRTATLPSPA